jgi:hypothetical protein
VRNTYIVNGARGQNPNNENMRFCIVLLNASNAIFNWSLHYVLCHNLRHNLVIGAMQDIVLSLTSARSPALASAGFWWARALFSELFALTWRAFSSTLRQDPFDYATQYTPLWERQKLQIIMSRNWYLSIYTAPKFTENLETHFHKFSFSI